MAGKTRKQSPKAVTPAAKVKKLFVLDTNVLLHDPHSLFKFKEHDVFIPFVTVEELDGKKAGSQDVNRNARQATRLIEEVLTLGQKEGLRPEGYPLAGYNGGICSGSLLIQQELIPFMHNELIFKNDNLYLAVLQKLVTAGTHEQVVMVTKDLNLRIKARAMGFVSQDYLHDHALDDGDLIYKGIRTISEEQLKSWGDSLKSYKEGKVTHYVVPREPDMQANEFLVFPGDRMFRITALEAESVHLESVIDYTKEKNEVMGITARNDEQAAALSLLMDPDIDLVALLGPAGTGKTLMTVAAAMKQIVDEELYDQMLFTRATVPLGEDIGFLPGDEVDKISPWLGALWDNVDVIVESDSDSEIEQQKLREQVKHLVEVKAITFMRGRTFYRKFVVIDEAQNLTPKQMKALVTRAGEGTKLVCLGNLAQIDSPYLSETSSGLAYLVERFKNWQHFGALVLEKGERSRLASEGNVRL